MPRTARSRAMIKHVFVFSLGNKLWTIIHTAVAKFSLPLVKLSKNWLVTVVFMLSKESNKKYTML